MNVQRVIGHYAVAGLFVTVWEAAAAMPSGSPSGLVVAAGLVVPPVVASASLGLIALGERRTAPVPQPRPMSAPQQRRALPAGQAVSR